MTTPSQLEAMYAAGFMFYFRGGEDEPFCVVCVVYFLVLSSPVAVGTLCARAERERAVVPFPDPGESAGHGVRLGSSCRTPLTKIVGWPFARDHVRRIPREFGTPISETQRRGVCQAKSCSYPVRVAPYHYPCH